MTRNRKTGQRTSRLSDTSSSPAVFARSLISTREGLVQVKMRDEFLGIFCRNFYDSNTARSLSIKVHFTAPLVKVTCAKILPLPERTLATSSGLGAVITSGHAPITFDPGAGTLGDEAYIRQL